MRAVVYSTRDLRTGDRLHRLGEVITYRPARVVAAPLGPIEPGSPVEGVHFEARPGEVVEFVLYPSQADGLAMHIERDE